MALLVAKGSRYERSPAIRPRGLEWGLTKVPRNSCTAKSWELPGLSTGSLAEFFKAGRWGSARAAPQGGPLLQPEQELAGGREGGEGPLHRRLVLAEVFEQWLEATGTAAAEPLLVLLSAALADLQPAKRKLLRDGARKLLTLRVRDGGLLRGQLQRLKAQGRCPVREGTTTFLLPCKLQNELKQRPWDRLLDIVGLDAAGYLLEERLRFPVPPGGLAVIP